MNKASTLSKSFTYLLLSLLSLLTVSPFILIFNTSLKTMSDVVANGPTALPKVFQWKNYITVWNTGNMSLYFKNSIIVTVICVIMVVFISLLGAYAFSYFNFKGKEVLFTLIVLGLVIPTDLIIIPLFYNLNAIGMINTRWAIILPQVATILPFSIYLIRGFMKDLPPALLESARLDGSNEFQSLYYIIVPLVKPAIVSVIIYTTIWTWNNFMFPTILIQDDKLRTLPVGLNYFKGKYVMDYCKTAAAANISAIPTLVVYFILQKKFIKGMLAGAIKE